MLFLLSQLLFSWEKNIKDFVYIKFCPIAIFIITNLRTIFHVVFTDTFMIYCHTKYQISGSNDSLVIANKPNSDFCKPPFCHFKFYTQKGLCKNCDFFKICYQTSFEDPTLWHQSCFHINKFVHSSHYCQQQEIKRYEFGGSFCAIIFISFIQNLLKTIQMDQKLKGGTTHWQHGDLICPLSCLLYFLEESTNS